MSQNLRTLLTVAAELRSAGASWEAVAAKVARRPCTCQNWPSRFRADWGPLYREAQERRYEEAGNEALALLRRHMRDVESKTSLRAVELMLRYGRRNAPGSAEPEPSAEDREWADIRAVTEDARRRFDAERTRQGLPPATDDEFFAAWCAELTPAARPPTAGVVAVGVLLLAAALAALCADGPPGSRQSIQLTESLPGEPTMPRTAADADAELIRRVREVALLNSSAGVLGWDERTYMPRHGSAHRAEQMALLARLAHESFTAPVIGELLAEVEASELVRDPEADAAVNARELRRSYDRATKLPPSLVEELARTTTQAQQAWQEARAADDFASFRPWLEKVVALKRQEAQAVGYQVHPYDALLDEYEPSARAADLRQLFAGLAKELTPLVAELTAAPRQPDPSILGREFPVEQQKVLAQLAAAAVGFDFEAGRLDTTTHPFCTGLGPGDVRILTRYHVHRFNDAFFGVLHESGHGLYEQGLPAERFGTPLGSACSLGIHESQSRLWENQVGRSRPFWEYFFPIAQGLFGSLRGVGLDDFHFAINAVQPSFVRVDADEATYNLHIILRFELEQSLLTGDLAAADVPGAWNQRFEQLLGLKVPSNAQGCLQDIHWAMGGLGYFPTYTLGNLYAAQFMEKARADLGGSQFDDDLRGGRFGRLKAWLADHVYRHGQRYRATELARRVTGRPLSPGPFLEYLRAKYEPLYGV